MKTKLLTTTAVLGFAVLGLTVGSGVAHAGSVTDTYYIPSSSSFMDTNFSGDLAVAGFTMAGKTLDSVDVTLIETLQGTAQATNTSTSSSGTGNIALTNTATATITPTNSVVTVNSQSTPSFTLAKKVAGSTANVGATYPLSGSAMNSATYTTDLTGFEGASFNVPYSDVGATTSSFSGGNEVVTVTDQGRIELEVTYNYSPTTSVPEPASLALLGSGLVGLGFARRRRNKA